jgi:3-oxoacyl-[acyl-carrier-protein] synthase II
MATAIVIRGAGWLTREAFGCIRTAERHTYGVGRSLDLLPKDEIFLHPVKNYGRFDAVSRLTCSAVSLALKDAGIEILPSRKQDIGIIGTGSHGSLRSDISYFRDYIDSGRTLSRGNLFIYTLPSSPLGEAAIHFGLLGPVLYVMDRSGSMGSVLDAAEEMVRAGEAGQMLAGQVEEGTALYVVVAAQPEADQGFLCTLDEARSITRSQPIAPGMIDELIMVRNRKGNQ